MIHNVSWRIPVPGAMAMSPATTASLSKATKYLFGSGTATPKNSTISDDEETGVMQLDQGGSIRSPLPHGLMVDNSFARKATNQFGIA